MIRPFCVLILDCLLLAVGQSANPDGYEETVSEVLAAIDAHYYRPVEQSQIERATMADVLAQLDPHSHWISAAEAQPILQALHGNSPAASNPTVQGMSGTEVRAHDWESWSNRESRIAYLRIHAFDTDTAREMRAALYSVNKAKATGLVLDLRFNQGGLLAAGIEVADLFVNEGPIVQIVGRNGQQHTYPAHKERTLTNLPLILLTNRETASTAEVLAACLQDAGRASVCGEQTHGKGSVQSLIHLPSGAMLKLTTAHYRHRDNRSIDRYEAGNDGNWGVVPNAGLAVPLSDEEYRTLAFQWYHACESPRHSRPGPDRVLERAVQWLRERITE